MLLYNKNTKLIERKVIPTPVNMEIYMANFDDNIEPLFGYDDIDIFTHYIENNKPIRMTEQQQKEVLKYGRFLTEDERILESMKPSREELEEAEMTIKVLSILEGVL